MVSQRKVGITTDHTDETASTPVFTDGNNKIVLPVDHRVTNHIIAVCHQGDHIHRSADETLREFREHYFLHTHKCKTEEKVIHNRCYKCLSYIKSRTGKTMSRPMWYMTYVTRPFEYIHIDFVELPMTKNGKNMSWSSLTTSR